MSKGNGGRRVRIVVYEKPSKSALREFPLFDSSIVTDSGSKVSHLRPVRATQVFLGRMREHRLVGSFYSLVDLDKFQSKIDSLKH